MDDITLNFREILVKKPFVRPTSTGYLSKGLVKTTLKGVSAPEDILEHTIVTQADFLRELEPSGHAINSPYFYPDIVRENPDTGKKYIERVVRCAFAFQSVIALKQIIHLTGNDIKFELPADDKDGTDNEIFKLFRKGWAEKDMEVRFYEAAKSLKITGDCALVGYIKEGKFGMKSLSYLDGDTLYPHFDSLTGDLKLFARRYSDYDEDGEEVTEWVEIWDEKYLYRCRKGKRGTSGIITRIKEAFGLSGYEIISKKEHGFNFVPIAYQRDEKGACWSRSQTCIDQYELAFSQLSQNNQAYAFPIMYLKGEEIELQGNMDGAVKVITMGTEDDAGFLQKQDASASFSAQLDKLYKMIYELSFAVIPPELKSGDLPGVAVKLLYSPAYENAMHDAMEMNNFLDTLVRIFKYGYGLEIGQLTTLAAFKVYAYILPYYHQSQTEFVTNIAAAVDRGFLSRRTASEKCPDFPTTDEFDRIMREKKMEAQEDIINEIDKYKQQAQVDIEKARAEQEINNGNGQGSSRTRHTDENGNWPNENNWANWNETH